EGGCAMWKPEHRRVADRRGSRFPSDLTDAEWALVEPMILRAKRGGRKRSVDVRAERDLLCAVDGLPVERRANRPAAEEHDLRLSRSVGLGWRTGAHLPGTLPRHARASGARGGRRSIRQGMTWARRSRAASGTFSSTRSAS